jgi:DNA ligase 1
MERFAELIDRLVYTPSRNRKLDCLADYFRTTPDPDRGYGLAALTDGLSLRLPLRRIVAQLLEPHVDPVLYRLSRDYVGDTAETVALLWPETRSGPPPRLAEVVEAITAAGRLDAARVIAGFLDRLDSHGRFALLKLLTGALRTGVSARLAKTGLARWAARDVSDIEEVWHGLEPPYLPVCLAGRPRRAARYRRPAPVSAVHARPSDRAGRLVPARAVGLSGGMEVGRNSRPDRRTGRRQALFAQRRRSVGGVPRIVEAFAGLDVVADGELLVVRDGAVMPFNDLQQRLNRKSVTARQLAQFPAHLRLYDLLQVEGEDMRPLAFTERRERLETWHRSARPPRSDLSDLIAFTAFEELDELWSGARARGLEGLMLKRKSSPYLAGRPRGHWFKWKRHPLTWTVC